MGNRLFLLSVMCIFKLCFIRQHRVIEIYFVCHTLCFHRQYGTRTVYMVLCKFKYHIKFMLVLGSCEKPDAILHKTGCSSRNGKCISDFYYHTLIIHHQKLLKFTCECKHWFVWKKIIKGCYGEPTSGIFEC